MTKSIQLGNITIEYFLNGENNSETILFVHGLGANLSQFKHQQNYFSKNFKVLSVNLRGHGNTTLTHALTSNDVELYKIADDITTLLDRLGISKVHYVGNSMGGNVGFEIMKTNPNILKTITTYGTTGQLNTSSIALKIMKFLHKIITPTMRGNLSKIAGQTNESKAKIKEMMLKSEKATILSFIPILANFDYLEVIKKSKIPCMIIKGEKDKEINNVIYTTIREFKNRGNFELQEINGAGHFANLDNPYYFNKIIEEYILHN
ncbi:alpha/beta fold hydrolase [Aquimarina longa]|uniref:alpha/beta fold hydrolase n=1 Tax=Aquimarina longa TaxID=1080221 RepID=UPI000784FBDB|nr:alpha/beta hydrolase [Aquimarina longa]